MSSQPCNFAIVQIEHTSLQNLHVIVASNFLAFNQTTKQTFVRYLEPPYVEQDELLLKTLTTSIGADPPADWPLLKCHIVCGVSSYEEGQQKLNNLKKTLEKQTNITTEKSLKQVKGMKNNKPKKLVNESYFKVPELTYNPPKKSDQSQSRNVVASVVTEKSAVLSLADEEIQNSGTDKVLVQQENNNFDQDGVVEQEAVPTEVVDFDVSFMLTKEDLSVFKESLFQRIDDGLLKLQESLTKKIDNDFNELQESLTKKIVNDFNELKKSLKSYIKEKHNLLDAKIIGMQRDLERIKTWIMENRPFTDNENIVTAEQLSQMFEQSLPIENYVQFQLFDEKIDGELYTNLKKYFVCNINTKEEKKISVVTIIFKDFFSRDLMKSFTAKKRSGTKPILSKTRFYKCFLEAMMTAYNVDGGAAKVTNDNLLTIIGSVINNSSDWNGFRALRQRRRTMSGSGEDDEEIPAKISKSDLMNDNQQTLTTQHSDLNINHDELEE